MNGGHRLTVARARVRGAAPDARRWLEAALDRVDLARLGLPPRAVLYIPRLDPATRLRRGGAVEMGAAVEAALRGQARAAVPGEGTPPAGRPLLFDCEAEFLAWMLAGWLRRRPEATAALTALAGRGSPAVFVTREILTRGDLLPSLFERIAARGELSAFVATLPPTEARAAVARMALAHDLRLEEGRAPAARRSGAALPPGPHGEDVPRRRPGGAGVGSFGRVAREVVPEAFTGPLPGGVQDLVLLALALARAPAWARSEAMADWLASPPLARSAIPLEGESGPPGEPGPSRRSERPEGAPEDKAARAMAFSAGTLSGTDERAPARPRLAPAADRLDTGFGGLLFVLNVLLRLGILADFSQPTKAGASLSPWLLLRRFGRAWFHARLARDPLDRLLAQLAGLEPGARQPSAPRRPAWGAIEAQVCAEVGLRLGRSGREALGLLCARPALLTLSPGALDAEFALEHHPVTIRAAGFDRDPGWLPSAGRAVAFHFR